MLIKASTGAATIQPFAVRSAPAMAPAAAPAEPRPTEDPRVAILRQENAELRRTLAELRESAPAAEAKAREQGRREGVAGAQDDSRKRLEALQGGVDAAVAGWTERLDGLDGLAALLARAALAKMFDQADEKADLVVRMIARQVGTLRRETLLAVRVSPRDFPDEPALAAIAGAAGAGTVKVCADAELGAGDCCIDLQLGHVDLSLSRQWAELSALLDGMADEEAAS